MLSNVLYERCNEERLSKVLKSTNINDSDDLEWTEICRKLLKNYSEMKFKNGGREIKYTQKNNGRLIGNGIQRFPRFIRSYILTNEQDNPMYKDIDVHNCHPVILENLFTFNNIQVPEFLKKYNQNRKETIEEYNLKDKYTVIKMLNSSDYDFTYLEDVLLASKYNELVQFHKSLYTELYKKLYCKYSKDIKLSKVINRKGSFMSQVLQIFENILLNHIREFLKNEKIGILMFDGLMVEEPCNINLTSIEEYVFKKSNIPIKLTFKDVKTEWIPDEARPILSTQVDDNEILSVERAQELIDEDVKLFIDYLNNFFCKVSKGDSVLYCDRETIKSNWLHRNKKAFLESYEHCQVVVGKKTIPITNLYLHNDNIKIYNNVVMDPSFNNTKNLNLFKGFVATLLNDYDEDIINPIIYHIKTVLNDNSETHFDFNIKLLAHIVQKPWIKTGCAIVVTGEQGIGKSIFYEWFGRFIIGMSHYFYSDRIEDVTGQFTTLHADKILGLLDEISFAGDKKTANTLKSLITRTIGKLEAKGLSPIMIDNFLNLIFISNADDAVRLESGDRRNFVKKGSNIHLKDFAYFDKLAKHLERDETKNHFFTYLMNMDIDGFNPRNVPDSDEKESMKIHSMSSIELFCEDVKNGEIPFKDDESQYYEQGKVYDMNINDLWNLYSGFCAQKKAGNYNQIVSKAVFSKKIRKLLNITDKTSNRNGGAKIRLSIPH